MVIVIIVKTIVTIVIIITIIITISILAASCQRGLLMIQKCEDVVVIPLNRATTAQLIISGDRNDNMC